MKTETFKLNIDNKTLEVEFNNLAERTNSSVFVRMGNTVIMATAVMSNKEIEGIDFFPLTVAYEERFYAVGKILGSRFTKREGRPSEQSILTSRLIDRAIRPLFPKNFRREVQIIITCLAWDKETDLALLGAIAASIVLSTSDIPWEGPIAPVRIGSIKGELKAFPTFEQRETGDMDLLLTGLKSESKKEILINMIDAGMNEIPEETILKAVEMSKKYHQDILNFQEDIKNKIGKEKIEVSLPQSNEEVEKLVKEVVGNRIENIFKKNPTDDMHKIRDDLALKLKEIEDADALRYGFSFFEEYSEKIIHQSIIEKGLRFEERGTEEIREIFCDVSKIPMVHGSGLFSRGETRVLSFLTLGSPGDQKVFDENGKTRKEEIYASLQFPTILRWRDRTAKRTRKKRNWSRNVGRKSAKTSYP